MNNMAVFEHTHNIRVRYAETDQMGIVWNGNYNVYFEVGRTELMRHFGLQYRNLEKHGYILPLRETYSKYLSPAYYDDELVIKTEFDWNNSAVIKFVYTILREDTVIATGYTTHMFVTLDSRRPVKPPKLFVDALNEAIDKEQL
jgi:acyl-CoA thioester hydrolase